MTALIRIFLLLSALFSGSEIAFVSANKLRVELKKKKGSRRGAILARFYERPANFLGTMLVGNNIALVIFTALMTVPLTVFFNYLGINNELILLLVYVVFGRKLP